jgi:hypothetical protein
MTALWVEEDDAGRAFWSDGRQTGNYHFVAAWGLKSYPDQSIERFTANWSM